MACGRSTKYFLMVGLITILVVSYNASARQLVNHLAANEPNHLKDSKDYTSYVTRGFVYTSEPDHDHDHEHERRDYQQGIEYRGYPYGGGVGGRYGGVYGGYPGYGYGYPGGASRYPSYGRPLVGYPSYRPVYGYGGYIPPRRN